MSLDRSFDLVSPFLTEFVHLDDALSTEIREGVAAVRHECDRFFHCVQIILDCVGIGTRLFLQFLHLCKSLVDRTLVTAEEFRASGISTIATDS